MTTPISSAAAAAVMPAQPSPGPPQHRPEANQAQSQAQGGAGGQGGVTIDVSWAKSTPVYVYRVTDTATGRVLVELPQVPEEAPGERVDARV